MNIEIQVNRFTLSQPSKSGKTCSQTISQVNWNVSIKSSLLLVLKSANWIEQFFAPKMHGKTKMAKTRKNEQNFMEKTLKILKSWMKALQLSTDNESGYKHIYIQLIL